MTQGLLRCRCFDGVLRPGPEWSARCRENCAPHVGTMSRPERLKHRIVFGIDRKNGRTRARSTSHEQAARTNQALLVGESHRGATLYRRHRWLQPDRTTDRSHYPIRRTQRGLDQCFLACGSLDPGARKRTLEIGVCSWVGDDRMTSAHFAGDLAQRGSVTSRADRFHAIAFRLTLNQVDRARAYRSGSAKDRYRPDVDGRLNFRNGNARYAHMLPKQTTLAPPR